MLPGTQIIRDIDRAREQGAVVVELPRGQRAVARRPKGRPPKHGAYSGLDMMEVMREKDAEIRAVLYEARVQIGVQDSLAIGTLARVLAKIEMLDRWFTVHGLVDKVQVDEGRPAIVQVQPALKIYLAAVNAAARLYDQLGLTPQSRARLGLTLVQARKDLAAGMADERDRES